MGLLVVDIGVKQDECTIVLWGCQLWRVKTGEKVCFLGKAKDERRKTKGREPVAYAPSVSYADGGTFWLSRPKKYQKTRLLLDLSAGLSLVQESDPNKLLPNQVAEAAP